MQTILITGINGFLGSHLAKYLNPYFKIVGLEIDVTNLWRIEGYDFNVYKADDNEIKKLFQSHKVDCIVHTATLYGREGISNSALIENNVLNPLKLLETGIQYGLKAFINTDSFFNDEKYNYSYLSGYTLTKKNLLEWLNLYSNQLKIIHMKIFHMYGPNDAPGKFIPWILDQLMNNKPDIDLTPGSQMRDFIYISDVIEAYKLVLDNLEKVSPNPSNFEVGTGKAISIREFVEAAKEIQKSSSTLNFGALDYRKGEIEYSKANINSLSKLGWSSKLNYKEGLKRILHESR